MKIYNMDINKLNDRPINKTLPIKYRASCKLYFLLSAIITNGIIKVNSMNVNIR